MAVLVENPISLDNEMKSPIADGVTTPKITEVIHLKEARIGDKGLLHISNVRHKPEIVKYESKHKSKSAKTKETDNRSETTRPLTGATTENRFDIDKTEMQSTLSVTVERKPLHNVPIGRSLSEYGHSFRGSHPIIGSAPPLSSPRAQERVMQSQHSRAKRIPARMVRLATVSMSAK